MSRYLQTRLQRDTRPECTCGEEKNIRTPETDRGPLHAGGCPRGRYLRSLVGREDSSIG